MDKCSTPACSGLISRFLLNILEQLWIVSNGDGNADEIGFIRIADEILRVTEVLALCRQFLSKSKAASMFDVSVHYRRLGHGTACGILRHRTVGEKHHIFFSYRLNVFFSALLHP